jgi:hypothetical protein
VGGGVTVGLASVGPDRDRAWLVTFRGLVSGVNKLFGLEAAGATAATLFCPAGAPSGRIAGESASAVVPCLSTTTASAEVLGMDTVRLLPTTACVKSVQKPLRGLCRTPGYAGSTR